jgi:hypothetical protein
MKENQEQQITTHQRVRNLPGKVTNEREPRNKKSPLTQRVKNLPGKVTNEREPGTTNHHSPESEEPTWKSHK